MHFCWFVSSYLHVDVCFVLVLGEAGQSWSSSQTHNNNNKKEEWSYFSSSAPKAKNAVGSFLFAGRMARRHMNEKRENSKLETLQVRLRFHSYRIVRLLLIRVSSTIFRVPMRFQEKFFFSRRIQLRWFQYNVTYKFPNFEIGPRPKAGPQFGIYLQF